jgi:Fe-S-cluster containining protein
MKRTKWLKAFVGENPCLHCGACCVHYRVSFYWGEADPSSGGKVPPQLTEELTEFRRCMRGTNQNHPRCIALKGEVGKTVSCSIYSIRPSTCRQSGLTYKAGVLHISPEELERCTQARASSGLSPLPVPTIKLPASRHPQPGKTRRPYRRRPHA